MAVREWIYTYRIYTTAPHIAAKLNRKFLSCSEVRAAGLPSGFYTINGVGKVLWWGIELFQDNSSQISDIGDMFIMKHNKLVWYCFLSSYVIWWEKAWTCWSVLGPNNKSWIVSVFLIHFYCLLPLTFQIQEECYITETKSFKKWELSKWFLLLIEYLNETGDVFLFLLLFFVFFTVSGSYTVTLANTTFQMSKPSPSISGRRTSPRAALVMVGGGSVWPEKNCVKWTFLNSVFQHFLGDFFFLPYNG